MAHGDVLTLARYAAYHSRAREIGFTVAAEHALCDHGWPGNIDELFGVVHDAALQTDVIDVKHLPADVATGSGHRLSRIESFERDEIVRCLGTSRDHGQGGSNPVGDESGHALPEDGALQDSADPPLTSLAGMDHR